MTKIPREDMIGEILKLNPNAKRDELDRLSGEHLLEIWNYWRDQLRANFKSIK